MMQGPAEFAVIGAGPAGATLARILAAAGKDVLLFDHRAPWEKPCGGMLSPGALEDHPVLAKHSGAMSWCKGLRCRSPREDEAFVPSNKSFPMLSRRDLGEFLLGEAVRTGARFIRERVIGIVRIGNAWMLQTTGGEYAAHFIAGADGVAGIVRRSIIGPFPKKHLSLTCGYFLEGVPRGEPLLRFLDVKGYLWIFPRARDASAGIGARLGSASGKELFARLDAHLEAHHPGAKKLRRWSALLPGASRPDFFDAPRCGKAWLLLGDAAGFADPLTGEGIRYALDSAVCAGECLLAGDAAAYDSLWRKKFGDALAEKARHAERLETLSAQFGPEVYGAFLYNYFACGAVP